MTISRMMFALPILALGILSLWYGLTNAEPKKKKTVQVHYLEIVTTEVDKTIGVLEKQHGVRFGKIEAGLGNARTATLRSGGMIGVRAPLADHDKPMVRPYTLVKDIDAAVKTAKAAGGEIALPSTEVPGHGKFAIYFLGDVQHGVWEVTSKPSK